MKILFIAGLAVIASGCSLFMKPYNYNLYIDDTPRIDVEQMACHPDSMITHRKQCDPNLHI